QRERGDPGLGSGIGALPDAALEPGPGAGVDDAGVDRATRLRLGAPVVAGVTRHAEVSAQVDTDHGVPLLLRAAHEHAVAHEAGVVDDDVAAAEGVERRAHQRARPPAIADVRAVRDGRAAALADLLHHLLRRRAVRAASVRPGAEVVH